MREISRHKKCIGYVVVDVGFLIPSKIHTHTQIPDTLEESIKITLDRIVSKERYINNQFDNMQYKFRGLKQKLEMAEKRFETTKESVQELSESLAVVSDRLEEIKESQENRGSSMTDTGPLVRMKKAMKTLKEEMVNMEIRIGVLSHTLMQAKMRDHIKHLGMGTGGDDDDDDDDDNRRDSSSSDDDDDDDDDDDE